MDSIVAGYLGSIEMGDVTTVGRIGLVPLFNGTKVSTPYIALKTALERGTLLVEEAHESGTVGRLKVTNTGALPVLLLDGEELAGAKQNRVLNTTILVPANGKTLIPVSCTEQGRWSYVSSRFEESLSVAPPRLRRSNQSAVAESLRVSGQFAGNQSEVWSRVQEISDEAAVHSSTSAMRDVFRERLPALDEVLHNIHQLHHTRTCVDGIECEWDMHKGNHFIDLCALETADADLDLPPYAFVMH